MKFDISPMVVTEASIFPNTDKTESEHNNTFKLHGMISFNAEHNDTALLIAESQMISYGKYEVNVKSEFAIKFHGQVTEEEAENILESAQAEANIFPYISSYITGWLALSGYPRPNIPVVFFEDLK